MEFCIIELFYLVTKLMVTADSTRIFTRHTSHHTSWQEASHPGGQPCQEDPRQDKQVLSRCRMPGALNTAGSPRGECTKWTGFWSSGQTCLSPTTGEVLCRHITVSYVGQISLWKTIQHCSWFGYNGLCTEICNWTWCQVGNVEMSLNLDIV